jgi:dihydroflavonol-4-reductase
MQVLVTGATGLVGNNVVRLLVQRGMAVRVLTRATSDPRPLANLAVEVAQGDVRDLDSVRQAMRDVTHVVHSAGQVHIGWSGLELQRAINVEGTRNVAEAALEANARMVHVSSVDALGLAQPGQLADESTPRIGKTQCPYVITKSEAEKTVQSVIARGLDAVVVNPGFMIGPWDWKPSSGKMLVAVGKKFSALAPIGGCSICDVRDVAAGILAALERGRPGQNYILAGHNASYLSIWQLFASVAGSRPPLMRMGPLQRIVAGYGGDLIGKLRRSELDVNSALIAMSSLHHHYSSARAEAELGYQIRPLEESAKDAWNWLKEYGYV